MIKYKIEEAGAGFIGHWFYFMITALEKIKKLDQKCLICLDDQNLTDYQIQSLEILSHRYEYTTDTSGSILIPSIKPREFPIINKFKFLKNIFDVSFIPSKYFIFLRNLFETSLKLNYQTNIQQFPKKIFIKRAGSHLLKGNSSDASVKNIKRRQIENENELESFLLENGFNIIDTSNFHIGDKLLMFRNADIVLGANGGGLTYTFYAGTKTKICEIVAKNPHQFIDHYLHQSRVLNLDFYRFDDVNKIDKFDNIKVDLNILGNYLKTNNLI